MEVQIIENDYRGKILPRGRKDFTNFSNYEGSTYCGDKIFLYTYL